MAGWLFLSFFFVICSLFIQAFNEYQGWIIFTESILVLAYMLICSKWIDELSIELPGRYRDHLIVWLNMAVLLYFLINLYLFVMTNMVLPDNFKEIWMFHNFNNVLKNLLFACGIYHTGRKMVIEREAAEAEKERALPYRY